MYRTCYAQVFARPLNGRIAHTKRALNHFAISKTSENIILSVLDLDLYAHFSICVIFVQKFACLFSALVHFEMLSFPTLTTNRICRG